MAVGRHASCFSKAFKNVSRGASLDTTAGSSVRSVESSTLIFADWDDTLFPSTELFDRWGLELYGPVELSEEQRRLLSMWRGALQRFLRALGELSERCCIVTNAESGWVECCLQRFAPDIKELIEEQGCSVLHAKEVLDALRARKKLISEVPIPARYVDVYKEEEQGYVMHVEMSSAKYQAMRSELQKAFGRHQKGLNIINFGDMEYEHEAVLELGVRISDREPHIKSFLLPEVPRMPRMPSLFACLRPLASPSWSCASSSSASCCPASWRSKATWPWT